MAPKKNKKPCRNGYWEFVLECSSKMRGKVTSEVQNYAAQKWANMNRAEREPYELRAQVPRDNYDSTQYTSYGLDIDVINQEPEQTSQEQQMKSEISRHIRGAGIIGALPMEIFLIIHMNHHVNNKSAGRWMICEVAISAVSLRNGIEDIYHKIDEPCGNETEYCFNEIIAFMRRFGSDNQLPTLYAEDKTQGMIRNVFIDFCIDFDFREQIKIFNLQFMLFKLRNAAAGRSIWPNDTLSFNKVKKDVYSFTPDIACEFHEHLGVTVYCSKSIVTRYAYIICDNCCSDLNIRLIPGRHVPKNARVTGSSCHWEKTADLAVPNLKEPSSVVNKLSTMNIPISNVADSVLSSNYDYNFPALGSDSRARSCISFSSMTSNPPHGRGRGISTSGIERSLQSLNLNQRRPDHTKLKFPKRGYENQS